MAPQRAGRDITKQMLRHRQMVLDQMDFKQKAEEKKMSMSKNIARLAVTAGLTAALSFGGVMAPVTMAFADGATGSITINKVDDANEDNTFKAYQIFKAKVVDEEGNGKVASDIEWANQTIGPKVITAIQGSAEYKELVGKGAKKLDNTASASVVAEWLSQNVNGTHASSAVSSDGTRVAPGNVLYEIAAAVSGMKTDVKAETTAGAPLNAGIPWTRPDTNKDGLYGDGYYLFVSDGLTDKDQPNTGTSPIFAIVGGKPVVVTEKTSIPTVDKQILKDSTNKTADPASDDWANFGDSQIGQDIDYKLTGTVADNIASYTKYTYEFQDTLSKGLVVNKKADNTSPEDLHVYIVNTNTNTKTEVKEGFKATVTPAADTQKNSELLRVSFEDLKAVKDANGTIAVDKDSKVVVTYKARLTSDVSYEVDGNRNTVKLVYSNNPMGEGTGTSTEKTVADYAFALDVTKVDQDDSTKKLEAGFKVQVRENADTNLVGRWLSADGSLVNEASAYEFKTDKTTGEVKIPGLDAGTYQITETTTPAGYNTIAPFTIIVAPNYDSNGKLAGLQATVKDSGMVKADKATAATIPVTIQNKKGSGLPLTGLNGVTFTWIAGGAVLCIGVAHLIRSRKQAEESE